MVPYRTRIRHRMCVLLLLLVSAPSVFALEIRLISNMGDTGFGSDVTVPPDGRPLFSFANTSGLIHIGRCSDPQCAAAPALITIDDPLPGPPALGGQTGIVVPADGLPLAAYLEIGNGTMRIAKCSDAGCGAANVTIVDDPPEPDRIGSFLSLALGSDGLPILAYGSSGSGVALMRCLNPSCTDFSRNVVAGPPKHIGGDSVAVAAGSDGFPIIAFKDGYRLTVAKCNDLACSGNDETITVLEAGTELNDVGYFVSIAAGSDGLPIIIHRDVDFGNEGIMKAVKCNDLACTGGNEVHSVMVDLPTERVFALGRVVIGTDGFPMLSYIESVNGLTSNVLKMAKCRDAGCTSVLTWTVDNDPSAGTSTARRSDGRPVLGFRKMVGPNAMYSAICSAPACDELSANGFE